MTYKQVIQKAQKINADILATYDSQYLSSSVNECIRLKARLRELHRQHSELFKQANIRVISGGIVWQQTGIHSWVDTSLQFSDMQWGANHTISEFHGEFTLFDYEGRILGDFSGFDEAANSISTENREAA